MTEYTILELRTNKMKFVGDIEKIQIPMSIGNEKKESKEVFLMYEHRKKSLFINSMYLLSREENKNLLHIIRNDEEFEIHRARIDEFIKECSVEQPIPELTITNQYQLENGDVKIYFTGEKINHYNNIGYVYVHNNNKNKIQTGEINSTCFGYSDKVIDIICKKAKLYLLMNLGKQFA